MARDAELLNEPLPLATGRELIQGFDPVIQADDFTGAATLTIPLSTTPAREMSLGLALSYNSSAGNGEYGLGFTLNTSAIGRMTSRGVPCYDDDDRYALTGVGGLTPALDPTTSGLIRRLETDKAGTQWAVGTFLPLPAGYVAAHRAMDGPGDRDQPLARYHRAGSHEYLRASDLGRVADPADPARIFRWLVEETTAPDRNHVVYQYQAENGESVRDELRAEPGYYCRRYCGRIRYATITLIHPVRLAAGRRRRSTHSRWSLTTASTTLTSGAG